MSPARSSEQNASFGLKFELSASVELARVTNGLRTDFLESGTESDPLLGCEYETRLVPVCNPCQSLEMPIKRLMCKRLFATEQMLFVL